LILGSMVKVTVTCKQLVSRHYILNSVLFSVFVKLYQAIVLLYRKNPKTFWKACDNNLFLNNNLNSLQPMLTKLGHLIVHQMGGEVPY